MLQFIAQESDKYSIAEEVQMALEGGCRWIQLRMNDASPEIVRETALELIPMCKETEAFLIIESHVDVVAIHSHFSFLATLSGEKACGISSESLYDL